MTDAARARRNVRMLYAFTFLRDFHLWIPVWIVFLTVERGFSLTQVTLAEGLFLVGILVLEVPTGAVADQWGRSRSLGLGALCLGLATIIFAFTNSFAVLLTSFMIWSVASTLMSGADMAFLYDTLKVTADEGSYERSAGRAHAFGWAGAGIGTFLGGPVAAFTDIRTTIIMGSVTCLLTALVAFLMWEPAHQRPDTEDREHYLPSIRSAFGEVLRNSEVRTIVLFSGTAFAGMEAVGYLSQPYLIDRGIHGMVGSLVLAALAPALGFATDNAGLGVAFALGGLVTIASVLVFGPMLLAVKSPPGTGAPLQESVEAAS